MQTPIKLSRSIVEITGPDAVPFLQGLVTNDVTKASDKHPIYALMLTPQGKFLFDMFILHYEGKLLLEVDAARAPDFLKKMGFYKLRSQITLRHCEEYEVFAGVIDSAIHYADPRHSGLPMRTLAPKSSIKIAGDETDYHYARIALGVPDGLDMTSEKSFPLQFAFDKFSAIDYQKGCYVGQEVTARTHYQGTVRKSLFRLRADVPLMQQKGAAIISDGIKIGELCSTAREIGLALLDTEAAQKITMAECENINVRIENIRL